MSRHYSVPVIMLHSIGAEKHSWPYRYLSESVSLFLKKIDYLLGNGYHFIFHDDLYFYMKEGRAIPEKAIMLTFDDGYLDNWVIVFPLLKERGVKFTIYVSREFVDPVPHARPNLEDVKAGRITEQQLQVLGYLSWEEMRIMYASGLVDIQSHTSSHTWHFTGADIVDFYHPGNAGEYPWMHWNNRPGEKPHWLAQAPDDALWGLPIYSNSRAMIANRYLENPRLSAHLAAYVQDRGGREFFLQDTWKEELQRQVQENAGWLREGRHETPEEYRARMRYELLGSKSAIEENVGKEVRYLCWPGGAYSETLMRLAGSCGYAATTVKQGSNTVGDDPSMVNRISFGNPSGSNRFPWKYPLFTLQFYISRFQKRFWALSLDALYRRRFR